MNLHKSDCTYQNNQNIMQNPLELVASIKFLEPPQQQKTISEKT